MTNIITFSHEAEERRELTLPPEIRKMLSMLIKTLGGDPESQLKDMEESKITVPKYPEKFLAQGVVPLVEYISNYPTADVLVMNSRDMITLAVTNGQSYDSYFNRAFKDLSFPYSLRGIASGCQHMFHQYVKNSIKPPAVFLDNIIGQEFPTIYDITRSKIDTKKSN